jgi:hypothetical protein
MFYYLWDLLYKVGEFIINIYPAWLNNALCDGPELLYFFTMQEHVVGIEICVIVIVIVFFCARKVVKSVIEKRRSQEKRKASEKARNEYIKRIESLQIEDTERERQNYVRYRKALPFHDKNEEYSYLRAVAYEKKFPEQVKALETQAKEEAIREWHRQKAALCGLIAKAKDIRSGFSKVTSKDEYDEKGGCSEISRGLSYVYDVKRECHALWRYKDYIAYLVDEDVEESLSDFRYEADSLEGSFRMMKGMYDPKTEVEKLRSVEPAANHVANSDDDEDNYITISSPLDLFASSGGSSPYIDDDDYPCSNNNSNYNSYDDDPGYGTYEEDTGGSYGNNSNSSNSGEYDDFSDYWHANNGWEKGLSGNAEEDQYYYQ